MLFRSRNQENEARAKQGQETLASWRFAVSNDTLGHLLRRLREGVINAKTAKGLFGEFWDEGRASGYTVHGGYPELVDELIESRGLRQTSDSGQIEALVDQVLAANAKQVEDYRAGKDKAFNSLVGQVMKASRGKANPQQVNEILRRKLSG